MRDNSSAAVRPVGPAPAIKTGSVMISLRPARGKATFRALQHRLNSLRVSKENLRRGFLSFVHSFSASMFSAAPAQEIDAGLRRGDFDSTQSRPCANVNAEIAFDKAVKIAYNMRYNA